MVERGGSPGLLLEAPAEVVPRGQLRGDHLEGDGSLELEVEGAEDHPHPTP
jgi:hypothetical protein